MNNRTINQNTRYYRAYVSSFNTNIIHKKNPWVAAWWSAAFPGMGHLLHGSYIKGFIFFAWEFIINIGARINEALVYSFTGQFELAKATLDTRWVLLYIAVYIISIWDSYRTSVEINKIYILANKDKTPIIPFNMSALGLNALDKRQPWLALIWSVLMPGMGHLYLKRTPNGFVILFCWIISNYFSNFLTAFHLTLLGDFAGAKEVIDPQWALFLPSLVGFAAYDSYTSAVEYNRLFNTEQAEYLEKEYQLLDLKL